MKKENRDAWNYFLGLSYTKENKTNENLGVFHETQNLVSVNPQMTLGKVWCTGTGTPLFFCSCSSLPGAGQRQQQAHTGYSSMPKLFRSGFRSQHPHGDVSHIYIYWHPFKIQTFIPMIIYSHPYEMVACYSVLSTDFLCSLICLCVLLSIW